MPMNDETRGESWFTPSAILGGAFILLGVSILAGLLFGAEFVSMRYLWPIFVLAPGLFFEAAYFSRRKAPGFLIPGGILTALGALFFFEVFTDWTLSAYTWPVYIYAVAIGFYQYYLFGFKPKGMLLVAILLASVATVATCAIVCHLAFSIVPYKLILPVIFILFGGWLVFFGMRRK